MQRGIWVQMNKYQSRRNQQGTAELETLQTFPGDYFLMNDGRCKKNWWTRRPKDQNFLKIIFFFYL